MIEEKNEQINKDIKENDMEMIDTANLETQNTSEENKMEDTDLNENELSMEELLKMEDEISNKIYNREIVYVKVVDVRDDYIYVDIGEKKEGLIPVKDFEGLKLPNIGTKVVAVLEKRGNEEKHAILSYRKAKEKITFQWLEKVFKNRERVKGRVVEQVKGGYIVNINGVNAFMPLSLSELGGARKHYLPVNAKVKFYVIDLDPRNKKVIISRRAVLEEDEAERRKKVIEQTQEGQITRVVVSKIIDNGIFVRYQGMEGFVKLEDVDWKDPKGALSSYRRGQRIKVRVLSVDRENQKIYFGIKQTKPNPVDILRRKFPPRSIIKGKVVEVFDDHSKVHIYGDIYGTVREEDYGYDGKPQKDAEIDAVVVGVNPETYELNLSIKRFEQIENRKRIEKYSKETPKLTLGQILTEDNE